MMATLRTSFSGLAMAALLTFPAVCPGQDLKPVALPKPQTDGGKPLMQALKERKSSREFSAEKLPLQTLSNLLWAAAGVNRPDGHRTSPSASNRQEIDIYVAAADALYLYDPKEHRLQPVVAEDVRAQTGTQPFVREAAVNLVYVADLAKMGQGQPEDKLVTSAYNAGFIGQNVYLYCASEGLAVVVRASVDRAALAKTMKLRADQRILLAQSVGYPKK
jgi:SagB-type dehydrogenase family enzyme